MWGEEHPTYHRLGRSLREELIACLLGGYGIPAKIGLAAYKRINAVDRADPTHSCSVCAAQPILAAIDTTAAQRDE